MKASRFEQLPYFDKLSNRLSKYSAT